jgi:hypothetical protein
MYLTSCGREKLLVNRCSSLLRNRIKPDIIKQTRPLSPSQGKAYKVEDFKRVFDILSTAHYGCVPQVYGAIKAKLYEVFELRRWELVKKKKPTLVQRLSRTSSVKE